MASRMQAGSNGGGDPANPGDPGGPAERDGRMDSDGPGGRHAMRRAPPIDRRPAALRRGATLLGLGGLIPFFALAVAALALDDDLAGMAVLAQIQYAASILSFLGALHWGIALAAPGMSAARTTASLGWGVLPSLYAWAATVAPDLLPDYDAAHTTLALLAAGFVVVWLVDLALYRGHPVPQWFVRLRTVLTAGATLAVLLTLLA